MPYKYQTLYTELKVLAERMPERSQLPSVRNIMEAYSVSQATVDRAINELRAQRIIDSVEGEGFFVRAKGGGGTTPKRLKVCLAQNDYPSTFFAMVEETFSRFYESAGHEFQVVRYPWAKGLSGMLKPGLMDAFIALPPTPDLCEREIDFLKALNIPSICLSTEATKHGFNSIATDFELGGMMAAEHLLKLGHRKTAILSGEPKTANSTSMFSGFRRQCLLAGAQEPLLIDCGTLPGELAMRKAYIGLSKALTELNGKFTAVFCPSDCCAIGALRACHENKMEVPHALSIVGFNGVPESEFAVPSITTLKHDLDAWVKASMEIITKRFEGKRESPETRLIAPALVSRESTGIAPSSN